MQRGRLSQAINEKQQWLCAREPRHDPGHTISLRGEEMLWTIFVVLLILWLLGFSLHIAGGLIHILLIVALIVLIINLFGRRN
jgi:hypothetical protein